MRTTLALDDDLIAKAQAFTGLTEKSAIVREALRALIERESARRLARLGASAPDIEDAPRRRPWEARGHYGWQSIADHVRDLWMSRAALDDHMLAARGATVSGRC